MSFLATLPRQLYNLYRVRESTVAVGGTPVPVAPEDADRVALFLSNTGAVPISISTVRQNLATNGFRLAVGSAPFEINASEYPHLAGRELFGLGIGGAGDVTIVEVLCDATWQELQSAAYLPVQTHFGDRLRVGGGNVNALPPSEFGALGIMDLRSRAESLIDQLRSSRRRSIRPSITYRRSSRMDRQGHAGG